MLVEASRWIEERNIPWMLVVLAIFINSGIIYLLTFNNLFLFVSGIIAIAAITYLVYNRIGGSTEPSRIEKRYSNPIRDLLKMIYDYIRLNKRYIITSSVGLIIAIMVLSQSTIVISSYQQFSFDSYIEGKDTRAYTINVENPQMHNFEDWNELIDDNADQWFERSDMELESIYSYGSFNMRFMLGIGTTTVARYIDTQYITTKQYTPEYFELLSQFPTFPDIEYNDSKSLFVIPTSLSFPLPEFGSIQYNTMDYIDNTSNGYEIEILVDRNDQIGNDSIDNEPPFGNITQQVDEVWQWKREDTAYMMEHEITLPDNLLSGSILMPAGEEFDLFNRLQQRTEELNKTEYIWGWPGFETYMTVAIPPVHQTSPETLYSQIEKGRNIIQEGIYEFIAGIEKARQAVGLSHNYNSPISTILDSYLEYRLDLVELMYISIVPLVIISLFLYSFALSITDKRKKEIFKKMRQRGASTDQIRYLVFAEIVLYTIIGSLFGIFLAITTSDLLLTQSGIFNNIGQIPVTIPSSMYMQVPLLAFLFAFDFNLPSMYKISQLDLSKSKGLETTDESFWERGHYDLVILGFAALYWLLVRFIPVPGNLAGFVYSQLGFLALAFTIIGIPLVVSHYFIPALDKLFDLLSIQADTLRLSFKSIETNKQFTRMLMTLLIITMLFSYTGMVTSSTIIEFNDELSHYHLGGDIMVEGIDFDNSTEWNKLEQISGVDGATKLNRLHYKPTRVETRPGQAVEKSRTYEFFGINQSTFLDAFYWEDEYAEASIESIISNITSDNTIVMQKDVARALNLGIGDTHQFTYGYRSTGNYSLKVVNTFDYFPMLVDSILENEDLDPSDVDKVPILGTFEMVDKVANLAHRISVPAAIIKIEAGVDIEDITSELYQEFSYHDNLRIKNYKEDRVSTLSASGDSGQQSPLAIYEESFIQSSLISMLLVSLLATVIGIVYFSFLTLSERKREMGIYRAFGMVKNQILSLLLVEILILVMISLVVGALGGLFISRNLFTVLTGNRFQTIPPFSQEIPIFYMLGYGGLIGLISLIMVFIPSLLVTREETGNALI